jgi:YidC/Oxa1 family membrane protein insertase
VYKSIKYWRQYRAYKNLPRRDRRIVIYSESGQDWHHFESIIDHLTGPLAETVCYLTSDLTDPGLAQGNPNLSAFCIGRGLIRTMCFQWLDADVMLMTMIDLGNLQIKRSINRVYYAFMFHSLISAHMADHADSYDHYDAMLCAGPHQAREIRRREELHDLANKQLVEHGYHRLEQLMAERRDPPAPRNDEDIHVLLAPSWGEQTILNLFGVELTGILLDAGFKVTLRPHYQTRWQTPKLIDRIVDKYKKRSGFKLVEQMGESDSLFDSHLMITEWSGAGMDYGMGLEKPVLYIDVPPKARNDSWRELGIEPFESLVRDRIGAILAVDELEQAPDAIRRLLSDPDAFRANVRKLREESVYNLGSSSVAAAEAIAAMARESGARQFAAGMTN